MSVNKDIIIALDEGTTNAKAVAFDSHGRVIAQFSRALEIATPQEGWVEQSAELLLAASLEVISRTVAAVGEACGGPGDQQPARNRRGLVSGNGRGHSACPELAMFTYCRILPHAA